MITDTISDMLTRIRNGLLRGKDSVEVPHSKEKENILSVLKSNGYINDYKIFKESGLSYRSIHIDLKYVNGEPAITEIKKISKPGLRKYSKSTDIKPIMGGLGIYIVSTSKGVVSSKEARKRKLGGEIICMVY